MSKRRDPGFQSSAGLVRDFEVDEKKNLRLSPLLAIVIPLALLIALFVVLIIFFG